MEFQTPVWVCDIMSQMISELITSPQTILEPTPGAGNLVKSINRIYPNSIMYTPTDFYQFNEKVDCIVGNPPFTPMKEGYKILNRCFELSDNIIFLMPWLALINSEKRTELYMSRGLKQIVHLPRRAFSGSRVQTCVMQFQKGYHEDIVFKNAKDNRIKSLSLSGK